jgi:hypothetical protein
MRARPSLNFQPSDQPALADWRLRAKPPATVRFPNTAVYAASQDPNRLDFHTQSFDPIHHLGQVPTKGW